MPKPHTDKFLEESIVKTKDTKDRVLRESMAIISEMELKFVYIHTIHTMLAKDEETERMIRRESPFILENLIEEEFIEKEERSAKELDEELEQDTDLKTKTAKSPRTKNRALQRKILKSKVKIKLDLE